MLLLARGGCFHFASHHATTLINVVVEKTSDDSVLVPTSVFTFALPVNIFTGGGYFLLLFPLFAKWNVSILDKPLQIATDSGSDLPMFLAMLLTQALALLLVWLRFSFRESVLLSSIFVLFLEASLSLSLAPVTAVYGGSWWFLLL